MGQGGRLGEAVRTPEILSDSASASWYSRDLLEVSGPLMRNQHSRALGLMQWEEVRLQADLGLDLFCHFSHM